MHLAYTWILWHLSAKNYQNRWKFDAVLTKTNLLSFFWDTVYTSNTCSVSVKAVLVRAVPNILFVFYSVQILG